MIKRLITERQKEKLREKLTLKNLVKFLIKKGIVKKAELAKFLKEIK